MKAATHSRPATFENERTGMSLEVFKRAFIDNLYFLQGQSEKGASRHDYYRALAFTIRDRLMLRWIRSQEAYYEADAKRVYYLSAEFLMGRATTNNILNVELDRVVPAAVSELGLDLDELLDTEPDAGLGNGGLGRLAACFLDSMAALALPACGYGIRYEFGIFEQEILDGFQVEHPTNGSNTAIPGRLPGPNAPVRCTSAVRLPGTKSTARCASAGTGLAPCKGCPTILPSMATTTTTPTT